MKSNYKILAALFCAAALTSFSGLASAQATTNATSASTSTEMTSGEVRKVDKENKKLTIKHGPLKNLDMPGMTMVFQVRDPSMVDKIQVGDKVQFVADKLEGKFTVMQIEVAR